MSESDQPKTYQQLVQHSLPPPPPPPRSAENELDSLINVMEKRGVNIASAAADPLIRLRSLMLNDLVPEFVELVEKYSGMGVSLQMDASNFLEGGREVKFEFGLGEYRFQLHGTVTSEGIAFHETRYCPDLHGELATGPMLRLHGLNRDVFREFVCERLTHLIRAAMRRR